MIMFDTILCFSLVAFDWEYGERSIARLPRCAGIPLCTIAMHRAHCVRAPPTDGARLLARLAHRNRDGAPERAPLARLAVPPVGN